MTHILTRPATTHVRHELFHQPAPSAAPFESLTEEWAVITTVTLPDGSHRSGARTVCVVGVVDSHIVNSQQVEQLQNADTELRSRRRGALASGDMVLAQRLADQLDDLPVLRYGLALALSTTRSTHTSPLPPKLLNPLWDHLDIALIPERLYPSVGAAADEVRRHAEYLPLHMPPLDELLAFGTVA